MKKKVLFPILALLLALGLSLPVVAHTEGSPQVQTLYAGQDIDVGTVSVWNDAGELHVKYETTGGWEMVETHLHVATSLGDIPQSAAKGPKKGANGNPIPGQFMREGFDAPPVTEWEEVFDLEDEEWPPCTTLYIAAHAVVINESADYIGPELVINGGFETPVVSDTTTSGWQIYDDGTAGLGWAVMWAGSYAGAPAPAHLELMNGSGDTIGWLANAGNQWAELDTDWDGPGGGISGEQASVTISQDLSCASPYSHCKLTYAWSNRPNHDDNGLEVKWDGVQKATHSGSGGSSTSWMVNLITGLSPNPSGTTTLAFTETGTADSLGMFLDSVSVTCTVVEEETAWAEGVDFPGKNWATYFTYHVQGELATHGTGTAQWSDDGDPCSGEYWWKLYVPDGTADMAAVAFHCDIALEDITTLTFYKKVTSYGASGWNPSVILLIDADGDGLEFGISEAMEWHFTHSGTLLSDDAFVECESPTGLSAEDTICIQLDAFAMSAWGADASGFLYGTGGYPAGLAGFQSSGPYGAIEPTDKVLMVAIVIGGAGSWMDETAYIDDVVIAGP